MCEPISIGAGIAAATAAVSTAQANKSANAATSQAEVQAQQAADATSLQQGERLRAARREQSRLIVAAGESGVSGGSFRDQLQTLALRSAEDSAIIAKQGANTQQAIRTTLRSNTANRPSLFSAGLQIAGGALGGYGQTIK